MQAYKFKSILNSTSATALRKSFERTVAVNAASVTQDSQQLKSWKEIPGPSSLPIIGQLLHFLPGGSLSDISTFIEKAYKLYGPIVRLEPVIGKPQPMIMLYDPKWIAHVLRGENTIPRRPGFHSLEYYRKEYKKTKGQKAKPTGLITDHDENWRQFRTTVNPVMLQPKTIKLYSSVLEEVADDMIKRIRSIRDENGMIKENFDIEMNLWALESIGVVALGGRLNCFNRELDENSPERRLIQCVHDIFVLSDKLDFQPSLWRYYPTKAFKKAMKIYEEQENLAKYFINEARKKLDTEKKSDDEKGILEKLLLIDEDTAVIMASDMLFAGVDTAANTITAIFYLLAMNPDKQNKLREELKSEDPKRYLRACIKEAIRMHPVVSGNLRQITKDYNIMGYRIPKDMYVIFHHQFLSQSESQYPRAHEYIPERWIEKDNPLYYGSAHPFSYNPFGFGVRMCIGRRIAELEIETFLSKIIHNFQIDWYGPPQPLDIKVQALNYIKGPFNFMFKDLK